jgi:hypothetical protein
MRYSNANRDPREITAKFDSQCAQTGKPIKKGDQCIYYPVGKAVYHMDSKQAEEYRSWQIDLAMGYDY